GPSGTATIPSRARGAADASGFVIGAGFPAWPRGYCQNARGKVNTLVNFSTKSGSIVAVLACPRGETTCDTGPAARGVPARKNGQAGRPAGGPNPANPAALARKSG